jgi:hypothetical protein
MDLIVSRGLGNARVASNGSGPSREFLGMSLPFAVVWLGRAQTSVSHRAQAHVQDSVAYTYRASLPMANIQYLCCSPIKSDPTYTTYSPPTPRPIPKEPVLPSALHHLSHRSYSYLVSRISPRTTFLGPPRSLKAVLNVKATLQERERRRRLETARCLSILPPSAFLFNPGVKATTEVRSFVLVL